MYRFKKAPIARSVMFAVNFDDGRTAYLVVENHGAIGEDHFVPTIARERQEQGELPEGTISTIKRVR